MKVLYDTGGRYVVVDNGCPGLKLYDKLFDRIALGNASFYDNMRDDGETALQFAIAACDRMNGKGKRRLERKPEQQ